MSDLEQPANPETMGDRRIGEGDVSRESPYGGVDRSAPLAEPQRSEHEGPPPTDSVGDGGTRSRPPL